MRWLFCDPAELSLPRRTVRNLRIIDIIIQQSMKYYYKSTTTTVRLLVTILNQYHFCDVDRENGLWLEKRKIEQITYTYRSIIDIYIYTIHQFTLVTHIIIYRSRRSWTMRFVLRSWLGSYTTHRYIKLYCVPGT